MRSNKAIKVTVGIFKFLLVAVLIFMVVYLAIALWNMPIENNFNTVTGKYGKNPNWLDDWQSTEIDDLYDKIGTEGEFAVAYQIYRKACEKLMLVSAYGVRATSSIGVTAGDLQMEVGSNRTEQYKVAGTPTLNANQKVYSSYTNTIYVLDVNNDTLGTILKGLIQFADRGYSDGTNSYKQKGKLNVMEGGEENVTWATEYAPEESTALRTYKDDEIREKCNFIVTPETILKDSVSIEREYDEAEKTYKYRIKMSLDCSDNSEGSATYYEAKAIGDVLGKNMKSLEYSKMDIDMTMYSNGYLMTWDTVQEWTLRYDVLIATLSGTALNKKYEVFSYAPDDCKVIDFTND